MVKRPIRSRPEYFIVDGVNVELIIQDCQMEDAVASDTGTALQSFTDISTPNITTQNIYTLSVQQTHLYLDVISVRETRLHLNVLSVH